LKAGRHAPGQFNDIIQMLLSRLLAIDTGQLVIVYQLRMMGSGFIPEATFSKYKRVEGIDCPNVNKGTEMTAEHGNEHLLDHSLEHISSAIGNY
jgi:hypothetical protein